MATHLTSPTIDALINKALAIEDEKAQAVGALGFMARAMVQPPCHTRRSWATSSSAGMVTTR